MHSFGHSVQAVDFASRWYDQCRISLIFLEQVGNNAFTALCFERNVDAFILRGPNHRLLPELQSLKFRALWFLLHIWNAFRGRAVVIDFAAVYRMISLSEGRAKIWDEKSRKLVPCHDYGGYIRVLNDGRGRNARLPAELVNQCRREVERRHPDFFKRPFVSMLLRGKHADHPDLSTRIRVAGPAANYRPAIAYLTGAGYNVVGTGETDHAAFENIPGYFNLDGVEVEPKLLNVFVLTECVLFIGNASGPNVLVNACDIPSLICDTMPYRTGCLLRRDVNLFKHIRDLRLGRRLSIVEVFQRPELVFMQDFDSERYAIEPSDPEEILQGAKESVQMLRGELELTSEDMELWNRFSELPSPEMTIYYQRNRTTIHILRQLRDELFSLNNSRR